MSGLVGVSEIKQLRMKIVTQNFPRRTCGQVRIWHSSRILRKLRLSINRPGKASRSPAPPNISKPSVYSANNFTAAVEAFESFLKIIPERLCCHALYWIGECHYTCRIFPRHSGLAKVAESYPKSSKTPDALLKLGYTLVAWKEKEKAAGIFEKIITNVSKQSCCSKST